MKKPAIITRSSTSHTAGFPPAPSEAHPSAFFINHGIRGKESIMGTAAVLFELGTVAVTPSALQILDDHGLTAGSVLLRHQTGDWSEMGPSEAHENRANVHYGYRVFSRFGVGEGGQQSVWVITEGDRSLTVLMVPDDYALYSLCHTIMTGGLR